jgi:hypothetical protein
LRLDRSNNRHLPLRSVDPSLYHPFHLTNGLVQAFFAFKTFIICYYADCFLDAALNLVGVPLIATSSCQMPFASMCSVCKQNRNGARARPTYQTRPTSQSTRTITTMLPIEMGRYIRTSCASLRSWVCWGIGLAGRGQRRAEGHRRAGSNAYSIPISISAYPLYVRCDARATGRAALFGYVGHHKYLSLLKTQKACKSLAILPCPAVVSRAWSHLCRRFFHGSLVGFAVVRNWTSRSGDCGGRRRGDLQRRGRQTGRGDGDKIVRTSGGSTARNNAGIEGRLASVGECTEA